MPAKRLVLCRPLSPPLGVNSPLYPRRAQVRLAAVLDERCEAVRGPPVTATADLLLALMCTRT